MDLSGAEYHDGILERYVRGIAGLGNASVDGRDVKGMDVWYSKFFMDALNDDGGGGLVTPWVTGGSLCSSTHCSISFFLMYATVPSLSLSTSSTPSVAFP